MVGGWRLRASRLSHGSPSLQHYIVSKANHPSSASVFIENNVYVDNGLTQNVLTPNSSHVDGLTSVRSVVEAKKLIIDAQALCECRGLRLHKFNSNEEDFLWCRDPSERDNTSKTLDLNLEAASTERVLGIQWSTKDDTFSFNISLKDQPSLHRSGYQDLHFCGNKK